ncbi:MAG: hypothetical protein QGH45_12070, partial [Myxococcota bacterium]|nr:hypothetical protein [Myxococcota bacterium]
VYGVYLQDQVKYGFGTKLECDLYVYVAEGEQPVTDATVTVAGMALPQDSWFEGRYRLQGSCVDPGAELPVRVERGTQLWEQTRTMPGFPALDQPAKAAENAATSDLTVAWTAADGAALYSVEVTGEEGRWSTDQTTLTVPADAISPFQHHSLTVTAYGLPVDLDAAVKPLSGSEPVWPGLTPITRVSGEFDFGPWLVDQNWIGDVVIQWWLEDGKTMDEDLFKVWCLLSSGGSYQIQRVKIAAYEQGIHFDKEIPWEEYDAGSVRIGADGQMSLVSDATEGLTWSGSYAAAELTLLMVLPPTEDTDERKRRRYQGAPKPWVLQVGDVESVEF